MNRLLLSIIFWSLLHLSGGVAQQLTPFVIASTGGFATSPEGQVSHTTGELAATLTLTSSQSILTQGFQQPWTLIPNHTKDVLDGFQFGVYPNPSDGQAILVVRFHETLDLHLQALDMTGRKVLDHALIHDFPESTFEVDLDHLSSGSYMLWVRATEPRTNTSHRFFQKIIVIK